MFFRNIKRMVHTDQRTLALEANISFDTYFQVMISTLKRGRLMINKIKEIKGCSYTAAAQIEKGETIVLKVFVTNPKQLTNQKINLYIKENNCYIAQHEYDVKSNEFNKWVSLRFEAAADLILTENFSQPSIA